MLEIDRRVWFGGKTLKLAYLVQHWSVWWEPEDWVVCLVGTRRWGGLFGRNLVCSVGTRRSDGLFGGNEVGVVCLVGTIGWSVWLEPEDWSVWWDHQKMRC